MAEDEINELPFFIPKNPNKFYIKSGDWKGWGDFLGTGQRRSSTGNYYSYREAKEWVANNELTKNITGEKWYKINDNFPDFIPLSPNFYYKKTGEWKGWDDFLGKTFLPYTECKEWVANNELTKNVKTQKEWWALRNKLPLFIPKSVVAVYTKTGEWKSWMDFLGKEKGSGAVIRTNFLSYKQAKEWVSKNELTKSIKSGRQWKKITNRLPEFIPKSPDKVYVKRGSWIGWWDFLDTKKYKRKNK